MRTLLLFFLLMILSGPAMAASSDSPTLDWLVGERLVYDIAFLWFDNLAEGQLSLERGEEPNTFRAELDARTLGVAAWLTRDRVQRYVSVMQQGPDGRLRSLYHESQVIKGRGKSRKATRKRYTFDYLRGQVIYERARNFEKTDEQVIPFVEPNPPNDILTAFYNFRTGFYGPLEPGRTILIPAFDRKGTGEILVEILTESQRAGLNFFPKDGHLARVEIDEDVFETTEGSVYIWFSPQGLPARGIVENIIGLGDVRGTMSRSFYAPQE